MVRVRVIRPGGVHAHEPRSVKVDGCQAARWPAAMRFWVDVGGPLGPEPVWQPGRVNEVEWRGVVLRPPLGVVCDRALDLETAVPALSQASAVVFWLGTPG